jgi:hypothetical protein
LKLMQPIIRRIHVLGTLRRAQSKEQPAQLGGMLRIDASVCSSRKKSLKTTVPEALDHDWAL